MHRLSWFRPSITIFIVLTLASSAPAGVLMQPVPAPEWEVSEWLNGDPGPLANMRGKVVLIEFFQLWCPGCNEFSIPLFKRWHARYGGRDDVVIVGIHTVFEGHEAQTPARLREFVAAKGIAYPVGLDAYPDATAKTPTTMRRYLTGGTPQVVIVDKLGQIRFSHFGSFEPGPVEGFIDRLLLDRNAGTFLPRR